MREYLKGFFHIGKLTSRDRNMLIMLLPIILWVLVRLQHVDITHDEAWSFRMVYEKLWRMMPSTANNHVLNSIFIWIEIHLLGTREWMIRIHSALSFLLFYFAFWQVTRRWKNDWCVYIAMLLLCYNSYTLDFFSLARGYAMGMAFGMMALYFILRNSGSNYDRSRIYFFLMLATLSVYTHLYVLLAYMLYELIVDYKLKVFSSPRVFRSYIKPLVPVIIFTLIVIANLLIIRLYGDLEEGYPGGFIAGCLEIFYSRSYAPFLDQSWSMALYYLMFFAVLIGFFWSLQKNKNINRLSGILFFVFIIEEAFHLFFDTPFSDGRTSLFYQIHLLLYLPLLAEEILNGKTWKNLSIGTFLAFYIFNIYYLTSVKNFNTTVEWWEGQGLRDIIYKIHEVENRDYDSLSILIYEGENGDYSNYYMLLSRYAPMIKDKEVIRKSQELRFYKRLKRDVNDFDYIIYPSYAKVLNEKINFSLYDTLGAYPDMESYLLRKKID